MSKLPFQGRHEGCKH